MFFSAQTGKYGFLSFFSPHSVQFEDITFPTAYHAYVYKKFEVSDPRWVKKVLSSDNATLKKMSNFRGRPLAQGWEGRRYSVMKTIVFLKLEQHPLISKGVLRLLETQKVLFNAKEHTFWGCYGENMLSKIYEEYRKENTPDTPVVVVQETKTVDVPVLVSVPATPVAPVTPVTPVEPVEPVTPVTPVTPESDSESDAEDNIDVTGIIDKFEKVEKVEKKKQPKKTLILNFNTVEDTVNTICIPVSDLRHASGKDPMDELTQIAKKIVELDETTNVVIKDKHKWCKKQVEKLKAELL